LLQELGSNEVLKYMSENMRVVDKGIIHINLLQPEPSVESIHQACASHIARYKLPRRIYYVDSIRRSPSGKADYAWAATEAMSRYASEAGSG
jgi:acyl-CoA synthetase (AMP-forming)/AMP-acid ligase II